MKILVINGHPDALSYVNALCDTYCEGVKESDAELRRIDLRTLDFKINLEYGYRQRTELEPDLLDAQDSIKWADHIVWIYPVWWGSLPALMKGFIDRVFLPGFAFQKREGSVWWDKKLEGKSARLISTLDQPSWFYRWVNNRPSYYAMKRLTMNFVGIKKVKSTTIGPLRLSTDGFREGWLAKVKKLAEKDAK